VKIRLKNIGLIDNSEVEINGITIIAGINATGKSTIGKALYSVFNSLQNIYDKVNEIRHKNIMSIFLKDTKDSRLVGHYRNDIFNQYDDQVHYLVENASKFVNDKSALFDNIDSFLDSVSVYPTEVKEIGFNDTMPFTVKESTQNIVDNIFDSLNIPLDRIVKSILQTNLDAEFSGEISNRYISEKVSEITLTIKGEETTVSINDDKVSGIRNIKSMYKDIVYIDDPYIIDDLKYNTDIDILNHFFRRRIYKGRMHHRASLSMKLLANNPDLLESIKTDDKLKDIYAKMEKIKLGNLVYKERAYKYEADNIALDVGNIAAGLKTFIIIKTLLENGSLESNGIMILDEPEIHLHPKWQLVLAELIVLIQKEFNMHILLNTHSPYFLSAIETYSKQHGVSDKCKYYLMNSNEENTVYAEDVTDNTEQIYKLLADPFRTLELL
jgi:predicted ATPase